MVERIVSGGQSGVDRGALDFALAHGLPCGGWCPNGRIAEDGRIPPLYPVCETPSSDYVERTAWNVRDSDGTLIITWGEPTEGTAFTVDCAVQQRKPHFVWDMDADCGADRVAAWLRQNDIRTLNVAGPRESKHPGAHAATRAALERVFDLLDSH
ncbi:MAG: molybdenum cofactor carrier [Candidatus Hydrogenedentes bacterium]|nr:molybdenum cofactor carrier [Candidatus Hydrogenedentota bacterium]